MTTLITGSWRKVADNILLVSEIQDLFLSGCNLHRAHVTVEPIKVGIWSLTLETAEDQLLERFDFLML